MSDDVSVIMVNYNSGHDLVRCLECLANQSRPAAVTIVDNASTDASLQTAYSRFPQHQYLPFRRNVGFARAVNLAMRRVNSPYVVLLNPDTLPEPDFLEAVAAPFAQHSELAAVAGTLVFKSAPHIIASAGIRVHRNGVAMDAELGTQRSALHDQRAVFGASGGAACYRRRAFLEAGGFPEVFFMYLEDVDLAWRLRLLGWEALHEPAAVVAHRYSGASREGSPFKRRLLARNRIWTLVRCLPDFFWRRDRMHMIGYDAGALAYGLARDRPSARGRLEAIARLFPRLCERRRIQRSVRVTDGSIEQWIEPAISPRELRRLRALTARLATRDSG